MKNKTHIKQLIRVVVFSIIFMLLLRSASMLLQPKTVADITPAYSMINMFYDEPENSLDVIYCGSSSYIRGISPMEIYKECGIVGYSRSSLTISPIVQSTYIENALRYQSPKVVVIDPSFIFSEYDYNEKTRDARLHLSLDSFPMGIDRLKAAIDIGRKSRGLAPFDYLITLLRYHSRWDNLNAADFILDKKSALSNQYVQKGSAIRFQDAKEDINMPIDRVQPNSTDECISYNEENIPYYDKIINMCKQKGIKILIVRTPKDYWSTEYYNALLAYTQDHGIDYLDFNLPEIQKESGYLPEEDFYDSGHANAKGAKKISIYLAHYLKEHYDLPDHRGDSEYESWDENIAAYDDFYQKGMEAFIEQN